MEEIKQWFREHPMLNVYSVEKELGLPIGTIRINSDRGIPVKYLHQIEECLKPYGYRSETVGVVKVEIPVEKKEVVVGAVDASIQYKFGKELDRFVFMSNEGGIFKKVDVLGLVGVKFVKVQSNYVFLFVVPSF